MTFTINIIVFMIFSFQGVNFEAVPISIWVYQGIIMVLIITVGRVLWILSEAKNKILTVQNLAYHDEIDEIKRNYNNAMIKFDSSMEKIFALINQNAKDITEIKASQRGYEAGKKSKQ